MAPTTLPLWILLGALATVLTVAGLALAVGRRRRFFGGDPGVAWSEAKRLLGAGNVGRLVERAGGRSIGPVERLVLEALAFDPGLEDDERSPITAPYRFSPWRAQQAMVLGDMMRRLALRELHAVDRLCGTVLGLSLLPLTLFGMGLLSAHVSSLWLGAVGLTAAVGLATALQFFSWRGEVAEVLRRVLREAPELLFPKEGRDLDWLEAADRARELLKLVRQP